MSEPIRRLMSVVLYGLLKYHALDGEVPLMAVMV
jgi:hypothetical protein